MDLTDAASILGRYNLEIPALIALFIISLLSASNSSAYR
jgi:hypothetical protein